MAGNSNHSRMIVDTDAHYYENPRAFGLQLRLLDRFGDNGIIAIVIGRMQNDDDLLIP